MKKPLFIACLCVMLAALSPRASAQTTTAKWERVAPGVWRAQLGRPEALTLLGAAGARPAFEALRRMPDVPFPLDRTQIAARRWGWKTAARFPLALDEEVYGLGVDFKSVRRTGSTFQLHVDHWGGVTGRTHAPVPLYVSTRGYAVLFNTARYLDVSVGLGVRLAAKDKPPVIDRTTGKGWAALPRSDSVEALVNAEGMEVFVFAGPTMMDAVRRYNLFNGWATDDKLWTHEEVREEIRAAIVLRLRTTSTPECRATAWSCLKSRPPSRTGRPRPDARRAPLRRYLLAASIGRDISRPTSDVPLRFYTPPFSVDLSDLPAYRSAHPPERPTHCGALSPAITE